MHNVVVLSLSAAINLLGIHASLHFASFILTTCPVGRITDLRNDSAPFIVAQHANAPVWQWVSFEQLKQWSEHPCTAVSCTRVVSVQFLEKAEGTPYPVLGQ